jgi:four helix bundle protein
MSEQKAVINSYRDLVVWQEAMSLAEAAYKLTAGFPKEEAFALTTQLRRSGASVAANIAEGYGRDSRGAYLQHLRIAQGSLKEFETHLLLAGRVILGNEKTVGPLLDQSERIGKMLRSLIRAIEQSGIR